MVLTMENVIKRYSNNVLALDHFEIEVKKGEVVGLLGPNGAGKTTAIKAIVGLHDVDQGTIKVFGQKQNGSNQETKKRIGFVTQEVTVYEDVSAYENLRFFGRLYGLKGQHLEDRIETVAKLIGLEERLKESPKKYSGGMKRRLNIGCSLLHEPELIIMDEPTVGIDPQSRNYILSFVKKLARQENVSIIYTSHYIEEVQAISDRVYIVDQGHIIADGTVDSLINKVKGDQVIRIDVAQSSKEKLDKLKKLNDIKEVSLEGNTYTIVAYPKAHVLSKILETLSDLTIENVDTKKANLEDVFLLLTGKTLRDQAVD